MNFQHIKSAIVFKAELPAAKNLTKHLAERPFEPLPENMLSRSGFVANSFTGDLVTEFNGGYAFTLREDSKVLPLKLVRAEAAKRIKEQEQSSGFRLKKVERDAISEQVLAEMCAKALVESSYITVLYHIAEQLLIVPTTSRKQAQQVVGVLVHVVGSVKTQTIHISDIKHGLTTRLKNHLNGDEAPFGEMLLGASCELIKKAPNKEKVSYQLDDLATGKDGLLEALGAGMEVHSIRFEHGDIDFKLTEDFHFKGISYATEQDYDDSELDDTAHIWRHEASIQVLEFVSTIKHLCDLLGYVPPADDEEAAQA